MELIKRINFKQPKYILPALLYLPLLFTGYFVIDIFHTKKSEIQDPNLETTEYYNDKLPEANVSKPIEGKMESMNRSYDQLKDFSAVDNIDRDEADGAKEEYESKYSEEERKALEASSTERELEMERQLRQSADRAAALQQQDGDYPFPLTERERLIQSQQHEQALREELEQALSDVDEDIIRIKGYVNGTEGTLYFNYVLNEYHVFYGEKREDTLVSVIGTVINRDKMKEVFHG